MRLEFHNGETHHSEQKKAMAEAGDIRFFVFSRGIANGNLSCFQIKHARAEYRVEVADITAVTHDYLVVAAPKQGVV